MTAPAGPISLAQERLRVMLADCTTFRALVGATTQEQALSRLFHDALPPPARGVEHTLDELRSYRPFGLVSTYPQDGHTLVRDTADRNAGAEEAGRLVIEIEWDVPETIANDPAEAGLRFNNAVGQIKQELFALAGVHPYLAISEIGQAGYFRGPEEQQQTKGDYLVYQLFIEWGQQRR